jgi:hypothetical protein
MTREDSLSRLEWRDLELTRIGWHTDFVEKCARRTLATRAVAGLHGMSCFRLHGKDVNRPWRSAVTFCLSLLLILFNLIPLWMAAFVQADGETPVFAVVSEAPRDKARVSAKVSVNDVVSDMKLLASETILNNLIWKKLEICHAMRVEGYKVAEGFQVVTVHVIDAGMLPMSLQSFAGDCLIKKAIEIAPLVD